MLGIDDVIGAGAALASSGIQDLFSARQAAMNRDYQSSMANNQIQRRVQDAMLAGVNPIFAVQGGMGAAAPVGAVGQSAQVDLGGQVQAFSAASAARASARKLNAEADSAEADAEWKKRQLKAAGPSQGGTIIESLPQPFQAPAAALSSSAKDVAEKIFGLLPDGSEDVAAMLKGYTGDSRSFVRKLWQGKQPTSAVEAGRASGASVLPGGAVVGRAIPGQLNVLRLKGSR